MFPLKMDPSPGVPLSININLSERRAKHLLEILDEAVAPTQTHQSTLEILRALLRRTLEARPNTPQPSFPAIEDMRGN
jgi:hypothetical protein